MIRPSTLKHRVDRDAVVQNRRALAEQQAREPAELPVRRRTPRAQQAYDAFKEMLEAGRDRG
ncbi:MAG TPA: hypothetical protein VFN92_08145 [Solirubrobacterales bacterium]|nr:hypothetical protein [Solirubrobacterales bacterium]